MVLKVQNLKVFIGPHMRDCCYEVGDEVAGKFKQSETLQGSGYI